MASQRALTYGTLKLCEYLCDNRMRLNLNALQETRYCVDAVLYRKRILKGHLRLRPIRQSQCEIRKITIVGGE